MTSIGDLYAPADNGAARVVHSVLAYTGLVVDQPDYTHMQDNKKEDFLKIFPHGKIPAFRSKSGFALFEGLAVSRYFAALAPESGLIPKTLEDQSLVDQWVHLIDTELRFNTLFLWNWRTNFLGPYTEELDKYLQGREDRTLSTINKRLEGRTYLVGDYVTLADLVLASAIKTSLNTTLDAAGREKYPNVVTHYERIAAIPSLKEIIGGASYVENAIQHKA